MGGRGIMAELVVDLKEQSYPLKIRKGLLNDVGLEITRFYHGKKVAIITDQTVARYYEKQVKEGLLKEGYEVVVIALPPGEESKSLNQLPFLYKALIDFGLTRSDLIVALGGGVVGDVGGFSAATFLRGIPFVQIPTTLLAQVDSSIGGKVAVDLPEGKNLVGSFYHPVLVLIDPLVLETLSDRFFYDGMAEVIKYACILDVDFFAFLKTLKTRAEMTKQIEQIIYTCCSLKKAIVESDERDTAERMLLNFGHTLGHALETFYAYKKYTHGEAVAIGMYQITLLAEEKGLSAIGTAETIKSLLIQYHLPYTLEHKDYAAVLEYVALDKKNINGVLKVVLLKTIGKSYLEETTATFFVN